MEGQERVRISCIGSGGVASSLLPALYGAGYKIAQVCSRKLENAQLLAKVVGASFTDDLSQLDNNVDFVIIATPDKEIEGIVKSANFGDAIVIHMAGSMPMDVFTDAGVKGYGVLYPMQTFNRNRSVKFTQVPIYVEASDEEVLKKLTFMAKKLSSNVHELNTEKRILLHIAAVFASNFTNRMLAISFNLVKELELSPEVLKPLIREVFEKVVNTDDPTLVQTGPASRGDMDTVQKHIEALDNKKLTQRIYKVVSESIIKPNKQ